MNELSGVPAVVPDSMVYDAVEYLAPPTFSAVHQLGALRKLLDTDIDFDSMVNIRVQPSSYLKYFAVCLNRTSGQNITIDDLHVDTFDKISKHSVLFDFVKSLTAITGQTQGDVEPQFLREWARLCFFANHGDTITQFIRPNIITQAKYFVDFESFYDGTILDRCASILDSMNIPVTRPGNLEKYLADFKQKNLYHDIDLNINTILDAIDNQLLVDLSQTNVLQQAWIDNYLVEQYNVDPLLKNEYFANTMKLVTEYNLQKGNS